MQAKHTLNHSRSTWKQSALPTRGIERKKTTTNKHKTKQKNSADAGNFAVTQLSLRGTDRSAFPLANYSYTAESLRLWWQNVLSKPPGVDGFSRGKNTNREDETLSLSLSLSLSAKTYIHSVLTLARQHQCYRWVLMKAEIRLARSQPTVPCVPSRQTIPSGAGNSPVVIGDGSILQPTDWPSCIYSGLVLPSTNPPPPLPSLSLSLSQRRQRMHEGKGKRMLNIYEEASSQDKPSEKHPLKACQSNDIGHRTHLSVDTSDTSARNQYTWWFGCNQWMPSHQWLSTVCMFACLFLLISVNLIS